MKKTIGILVLTIAVAAHAATFPAIFAPIIGYEKTTDNLTLVQGQIDRLVLAHNERFDEDGQLVATPEETEKFVQLQKETIEELRTRNAYHLLFPITNNLLPSANGEAYFILDEQKNIVAFTADGTPGKAIGIKQASDEDSILKIRPVHYLTQMQSIIGLEGDPVLILESKTRDWTSGGDLRIYCMMDKKKKKYSSLKVTAAKNAKGVWAMFYNGKEISKMNLKLWVNIFSQNGGVSEVTINGNVKVALEAAVKNISFADAALH